MINFQPRIIDSVFRAEEFNRIVTAIKKIKDKPFLHPDNDFKRRIAHDVSVLVEHHQKILLLAIEHLNFLVKPSYVFLSCYGEDGICPPHTDREQCKYTLSVCLDQREVWDLFIDGKCYKLLPNQAIIYSGTQHKHWRNLNTPGNFCDMAIYHFVDIDFIGSLK